MGDDYQWRGGSASFSAAGSWDNFTTSQSPALTPPGPSDAANTGDGSGTIGGDGDVLTLDVGGAYTFTGDVTAENSISFDFNDNSVIAGVSGGTLTGKTDISVTNGTVEVTHGGTLATNTGTASAGVIGDFSSVTVDDGSVATTFFGDGGSFSLADGTADVLLMTVGDQPGLTTTLDIGSGGTLADSSANIGASAGDDSAVTVHSGGVWTNSNNMDIGLLSTGSVEIESGGSVSVTGTGGPVVPLTMGLGSGSDASIDVNGGAMTVTGNADMGASGAGNMSVTGGGSFSVTGTLDEGVQSGGSGTLSVSDAGAAMSVGTYIIGDAGAHSDSITGSVLVAVTGSLTLGAQTTGEGTLTVSAGAALTVGGDATVGDFGSGSLDVQGNSSVTVSSGTLSIGGSAGGSGTVTLTGTDGSIDAQSLIVGNAGTGSLSITSSADLTSGDAVVGGSGQGSADVSGSGSLSVAGTLALGLAAGGHGILTVQNSSVTVTGDAHLGDVGTGDLTLSAGGTFSVTGTLQEGVQGGSSGTLLVDDPSAMLSLASDWQIGVDGAHSDTLTSGVTVDLPGALSLGVQTDGDGTLTLTGATLSVGQGFTLGDVGSGSLELDGGSTLSTVGTLVLGASADGDGTITLSGTSSLAPGADVTVGAAGSGSIDIGQGTSLSVSGALTLADQADSDGTISLGQGVTLEPGGNLMVGNAGTASVTLAAGATLDGSAGAFTVGGTVGGAGTITLAGTGAEVAANALTLGGVGTGVISLVEDTTLDAGGDLTLGATHGGGNGILTSGSGDISVGGNLVVGAGGIGSLDVNGGSLSVEGGFTIGNGPASAGDVTFANAALSIGTITVGNQGTATFSANQMASVTATNIVLGSASVGNGTFNLDGSGSEVQTDALSVGGGGTGALQVTDSAAFQVSGLATMGASAGAKVQETATIESNASWTIGGILDVGQKASGQVTIDSGGQVAAAQSVVIGDTTKASGTVTVTGTGTLPSALGFGSLLQVGNDGAGTLAVVSGGQVGTGTTAGVVEIGATSGAVGLVILTGTGTELQAQVLAVGGNEAGSGGTGTLEIGAHSEMSVADATVWVTGTVVMSGGTLATDPISMQGGLSGFGVVTGAVDNIGAILASGGTLELSGSITGDGGLEVSSGAELRLTTSVAASETIGMATSGAVLRLGKLANVKATVMGFAQGDTLVLDGVTADGGNFSGSTLTLTEAGKSVGTLAMSGSYSSTEFHVVTATGGSDVTIVPCFAEGTRLLTVAGEVMVEALVAGDKVVTRSGRVRPVTWIGHRRVEPARHARPQEVCPVRIGAGAFGSGVPHRDLRLSPDHAVYWRGGLIPVRHLCNGATIRQEMAAAVVYYHVELDAHDVLLAEGLPAESYLDTGNRDALENGGTVVQRSVMQ